MVRMEDKWLKLERKGLFFFQKINMDCSPFEKNHLIPSSWCSRCISCKGAWFKFQYSLSQRENPGNKVWSTLFPGFSLWDKHRGHWERGCGVVWSTMFCILVPASPEPPGLLNRRGPSYEALGTTMNVLSLRNSSVV